MIIDCIADLHGHYPELEGGDLLIIAGDLTARERPEEYLQFKTWLSDQSYKKKVVIAGNHDNRLAKLDGFGLSLLLGNCDYLCDSGTEFCYHIDGFPEEDKGFLPNGKRTLKIWGSPWTKRFEGMNPRCMAFTVDTEEELAEKWKMIPDDIDLLVTHSPPYSVGDNILFPEDFPQFRKGSISLRDKVFNMLSLKLHCFGHIHEAYGKTESTIKTKPKQKIRHPVFVNAFHVNELYEPVNKPIRVEI